jgi:hypothetical protein
MRWARILVVGSVFPVGVPFSTNAGDDSLDAVSRHPRRCPISRKPGELVSSAGLARYFGNVLFRLSTLGLGKRPRRPLRPYDGPLGYLRPGKVYYGRPAERFFQALLRLLPSEFGGARVGDRARRST